jgi:hypothetical protein
VRGALHADPHLHLIDLEEAEAKAAEPDGYEAPRGDRGQSLKAEGNLHQVATQQDNSEKVDDGLGGGPFYGEVTSRNHILARPISGSSRRIHDYPSGSDLPGRRTVHRAYRTAMSAWDVDSSTDEARRIDEADGRSQPESLGSGHEDNGPVGAVVDQMGNDPGVGDEDNVETSSLKCTTKRMGSDVDRENARPNDDCEYPVTHGDTPPILRDEFDASESFWDRTHPSSVGGQPRGGLQHVCYFSMPWDHQQRKKIPRPPLLGSRYQQQSCRIPH